MNGSLTIPSMRSAIAPGTVIADFYLPYLCCSDCPPIAYIIEEKKPDPIRPTINIVPKEFCNNDDCDIRCSRITRRWRIDRSRCKTRRIQILPLWSARRRAPAYLYH